MPITLEELDLDPEALDELADRLEDQEAPSVAALVRLFTTAIAVLDERLADLGEQLANLRRSDMATFLTLIEANRCGLAELLDGDYLDEWLPDDSAEALTTAREALETAGLALDEVIGQVSPTRHRDDD